MFFRPRRQEPPGMTLEGVLGPNTRLDDAAGMAVASPSAVLPLYDGRLLFSAGHEVSALREWGTKPEPWAEFDHPVTALAAAGDLVAIGLADGQVAVRDLAGRASAGWASPAGLASVSDCMFLSEDEIAVVDSGYRADENILSVASWDGAARGKVVAIDRTGGTRILANNLHCPMGIAQDRKGSAMLTLFERASLIDLSGGIIQSGFPGYLGRIRRSGTGYLISCLSRRDPLIEFLKTETEFVAEMKKAISPDHWLSPRARPEFSHDFPIELGATRLFGDIKPWAPSFSYGLVIETDHDLVPTGSAHSRANGTRHAVSDAVSWNGGMVAVSKASSELLWILPGSNAA